jgi:hypothetical protein
MDEKQGTNKCSQCLPLFHFHPSLTLTLSQVVASALLVDPLPPVLAHATLTNPTIVLVIGTPAVPLATTRTGKDEMIIIATTDDMTPGITNLIGGTGETLTATVLATRGAIFATAAVNMKKGIMTVDATNAISMTVTVDATAHRVDVPGVEGEMSGHGHPVVVRVRFLRPPYVKHA